MAAVRTPVQISTANWDGRSTASIQCRSGFAAENVSISLRGKTSPGFSGLSSLRIAAKRWWTGPCELPLPAGHQEGAPRGGAAPCPLPFGHRAGSAGGVGRGATVNVLLRFKVAVAAQKNTSLMLECRQPE